MHFTPQQRKKIYLEIAESYAAGTAPNGICIPMINKLGNTITFNWMMSWFDIADGYPEIAMVRPIKTLRVFDLWWKQDDIHSRINALCFMAAMCDDATE